MCRRGLLVKAVDGGAMGDQNVYRLTTGALGHATLESFQAR